MDALLIVLACVGQEPLDYSLLLAPKDGVAYVDVDPEAGVLIRGHWEREVYATGTLGKAGAAFKEMFPIERFTLLGRTSDGRLWTSRQIRDLWSWDGRSWSMAEVGFSADAEAAFRVMREKNISHSMGSRLQHFGETAFLADRTGVFAYQGGARWTYVLAVDPAKLAGRPGMVELRGWPGLEGAVCFQTGREGDGVVSWAAGAWKAASTLPACYAPSDFHSLFRFPDGTWVGFGVVNRVKFFRPSPENTLRKLVADLDDESFDVRERATRELIPLAHELEAYLGGAAGRGALTVEQRSRIEGIRSKRESALRVVTLEDGSVVETCEVIPVLQHPRTSKVLVVTRLSREEDRGTFWFGEIGSDGRCRLLQPAESRSWRGEPALPAVVDAGGAVYWHDHGGLVRWDEKGLAVRRVPGCLAGFGPGERAVFDVSLAAFEVSVDALRREFDRREEAFDDPHSSAGLDERGRLRILAPSGTRGTGGLHERTEWRYRVHERGEWREVPDSPTFATYFCTMRHCPECHEAGRREAPPERRAIWTCALAFTGRLLRDLATGKDVALPAAEVSSGFLLRGTDGSIWAATVAGLFHLREEGGELRTLEHQVREGGRFPLIRDGEGNVWQHVGRRVVRVRAGR